MSTTAFCLKPAASAVLAAAAALAPAGAQAWSRLADCNGAPIRWNSPTVNMYISTTSFPVGSAWDAALQDAMHNWSQVGGKTFTFYVGRDTDGTSTIDNDVNTTRMTSWRP
jgi:hypothetical protein